MYSTDNGAEIMSWPDGGMIPFRGEKNTTWEGGFRVPMMVRWPGKIEAGAISNEIISMTDWLPTLAAVGGEPDIKEKLLRGHTLGDKNFKVHLDGYNFLPYMTGEEASGPRDEFFYFTDDGSLSALRYRDWKVLFTIQEAKSGPSPCAIGAMLARSCGRLRPCACRAFSTYVATRSSAPIMIRISTRSSSSITCS